LSEARGRVSSFHLLSSTGVIERSNSTVIILFVLLFQTIYTVQNQNYDYDNTVGRIDDIIIEFFLSLPTWWRWWCIEWWLLFTGVRLLLGDVGKEEEEQDKKWIYN
jgi:hypothetical protein